MNKRDKARLEKAGWRVGDAQDFLELTDEEVAFIELRLELARMLRERREQLQATQTEIAQRLGSSQSRVAKMEACDASVSSDLLLKALLALGISFKDLGARLGALPGPRCATRRRARGPQRR